MKENTKKTLTNIINLVILVLNGIVAMLGQSSEIALLLSNGLVA